MRLILASSSPRRRTLLSLLVTDFAVAHPSTDESQTPHEQPERYVTRLAIKKAQACAEQGCAMIGADTAVTLGAVILGKPENPEEARETLRMLSGQTHQVQTAVAVIYNDVVHSAISTTLVTFAQLTDDTIEQYLLSDEPYDKAGAYGIQGYAGAFVRHIKGSYSAVVGLPLAETRELLLMADIAVRHG